MIMIALTLTSCGGGFDSARRGLENAGYTYYFPVGEEEIITTISRELDGLGLRYNIHYFKKTLASDMGVDTVSIGAVIELEKSSDIDTVFNDAKGNTLISLISDGKNSEYVRGNAILIPMTAESKSALLSAFNG